MLRSVIAVLLLNTFHCTFGYPVESNEAHGYLGKSLQLLAETCQNNFLSIHIKNHLEECNITLSPEREIKEAELECLIFYDMNSQLCTTLRGLKLDLNETFNAIINQPQKIDKTCAEASKNWKFTNITDYPKYYNTSQKVLKTLLTCLKACGVEDLLSADTNFFCKYYLWGSELLENQVHGTLLTGDANSGNSGAGPGSLKTSTVTNSPNSQTLTKPQNNKPLSPNNEKEQEQVQLESPKFPPQTDLENNGNVNNDMLPNNSQSNNEHLNVKLGVNKENPLSVPATHASSSSKNDVLSIHNDLSVGNNDNKDSVKSSKEKQNLEPNDDVDEYDSGPLEDTLPHGAPANDGIDPNLGSEQKPKPGKPQQKKTESTLNMPETKSDLYTNTMSDQFAEVDDHFFSFFLTGTILVIFFYILYHNKSKFRKVFLGLLVEGRQPGRRRNSRGHEYRRLDTLEQAMSTNSTAPPSKIIY